MHRGKRLHDEPPFKKALMILPGIFGGFKFNLLIENVPSQALAEA